MPAVRRACALVTGLAAFSLIAAGAVWARPLDDAAAAAAPDAPQPQGAAPTLPFAGPCGLRNAAATMAATAAFRANTVAADDVAAMAAVPRIVGVTLCVPHLPMIDWYARFLNGPQVKALTPLQKAHLAGRNVADPSNLATIAGARLVTASESAENQKLAESLLKDITGGDIGFSALDPPLCLGIAEELPRRLERLQVLCREQHDVVPTVLRDPYTLVGARHLLCYLREPGLHLGKRKRRHGP
jgi:hypothetical protein